MSQLYRVIVTDLGTYEVTVAADTVSEAQDIARSILHEEATLLPADMRIVKRESEAKAEPATDLPVRQFRVGGIYAIDFEITVPAADQAEAERHARRLYEQNCGPYEFGTSDERVTWGHAREVAS